ncbi:hypothetical protein [Bartonella raoultii]|uniref:Phage related protein n=1 Tax=Bartonella raoultii TaxID=1457020 RepID=A0ABS7I363_9HYPH|nr:hypothetical protein [Bartonella raoultii]MBX4335069.1 hypothetical protein [Bartonella raoultii]
MSANEILLGAMVVILLFSGGMVLFALYHRNKVKALKEEARKMRHNFLRDSMKLTEERDRIMREKNIVIKRRDQVIEKLKKQIKQYEEIIQQHQDIIKFKDDAKG